MQFIPLDENSFCAVIALANQVHGDNYLDSDSLQKMHSQGIKNGLNASFIAVDKAGLVVGYRLSFSAGQWQRDQWCSTELWSVNPEQMAYFKSVAVAPSARGQGVASTLLRLSVQVLTKQGASSGLAHIWRESPGNAAERYFSHAGATLVNIHPQRWRHLSETVGYICPCCGNLCHCSAAEMELKFTELRLL